MKALRYEKETLGVADVPRPLVNGEALVRVTLSGICNTDLEIARGYAGFQGTLGHEFVGVIESLSASATASSTNEPSLTAPPQPGCPSGDPGVGLLTHSRSSLTWQHENAKKSCPQLSRRRPSATGDRREPIDVPDLQKSHSSIPNPRLRSCRLA